jgi:hypothetical protein
MAKYDLVKIAAAIKDSAAHTVAVAEFEDWDDMGTCNFDAPYLYAKGMTEAQAQEIEKLSGVGSYLTRFLGTRVLMISGALQGQGNRRTKMAEAMRRHLEAAGLRVGMYYQMD